ncbi:hypothetical protein KC345_g1258 [Hortaea werneckii]|nr:hypothetical protein KC345_g1258 [Hortaea werneckii]
MGSGSSKPRPLFPPLGDNQFAVRYFKSQYWKDKPGKPTRYLVVPGDATTPGLLVVLIIYKPGPPDEPSGIDEFVINNTLVRPPASVARALKAVETYWQPILGLTGGWPPNFFLDAVCVNQRDDVDVKRHHGIARYIAHQATYVLDVTEEKAKIYSGNIAYTAPVLNYPLVSNRVATATAIENWQRVKEHQAGSLIWAEPE